MNGNNPYAGRAGEVAAGQRMGSDEQALSPTQRRALQSSVSKIAARTRELLPDDDLVGAEVAAGATGARAMVAVRPPVGNLVSAGFEPAFEDDTDDNLIDDADRDEVARGLAAGAVHQAMQAGGDEPPAAR